MSRRRSHVARFAATTVLAIAIAVLVRVGGCDRPRGGAPGAPAPRAGRGAAPPAAEAPAAIAPPADAQARTCKRVVDGDTVVLDGGERVRLVGVDTPELHRPGWPVQYFAREAKAFTKRLVQGRRVKLGFDRERADKYGRTLGYLWLEDGTFVNREIVARGYGFAYTRHPFRWLDEFRAAERAARAAGAGLWAHPDSIGDAVGAGE